MIPTIEIAGIKPTMELAYNSAPTTESDIRAKRLKYGQCPTCGNQTHEIKKKGVVLKSKTKVPLTELGETQRGRCLRCNPDTTNVFGGVRSMISSSIPQLPTPPSPVHSIISRLPTPPSTPPPSPKSKISKDDKQSAKTSNKKTKTKASPAAPTKKTENDQVPVVTPVAERELFGAVISRSIFSSSNNSIQPDPQPARPPPTPTRKSEGDSKTFSGVISRSIFSSSNSSTAPSPSDPLPAQLPPQPPTSTTITKDAKQSKRAKIKAKLFSTKNSSTATSSETTLESSSSSFDQTPKSSAAAATSPKEGLFSSIRAKTVKNRIISQNSSSSTLQESSTSSDPTLCLKQLSSTDTADASPPKEEVGLFTSFLRDGRIASERIMSQLLDNSCGSCPTTTAPTRVSSSFGVEGS